MNCLGKSFVLAALLFGAASPAAAQPAEERINVTFTPAFATIGGDTELALAGSIGYRFTDHFSFEGDFTWIDAAADGFDIRRLASGSAEVPPLMGNLGPEVLRRVGGITGGVLGRNGRMPSFNVGNINAIPIGLGDLRLVNDGQTMIGTLGVRYEPTVQTARFRPYVSGGIGLNFTDQEFNFESTALTILPFDESHSGIAFSAGGGASIHVFSSLWVNADAKYFRLSRDRNIMRLGGGVGFRF
jgi:opacity protein-like surface antigen